MSSTFPTIGILGGGQLARMSAQAATRLGLTVHILESFPDSPAGSIAHAETVGKTSDRETLRGFAAACDAISLESEFHREEDLAVIEQAGGLLYPSSATVALVQDKLHQKQTLEQAGVPVAPYAPVTTIDDARAFGAEHGYPFVLKARRGGYDGYGNATIDNEEGIEAGWNRITTGDLRNELYAEAFVSFVRELAVMVVRSRDGETKLYPVVETVQRDHICHVVIAPATIATAVADEVRRQAVGAIEAIDGVGIFGVELFESSDGSVLVNELAPRPHNSGHYTIEACVTSQFENHVRAVLGYPLGATTMQRPAAVMVNLLGDVDGSGAITSYPESLAIDDLHLHLYGKERSRPGRKMGHVTMLGDDVETVRRRAEEAAAVVRFGGDREEKKS